MDPSLSVEDLEAARLFQLQTAVVFREDVKPLDATETTDPSVVDLPAFTTQQHPNPVKAEPRAGVSALHS